MDRLFRRSAGLALVALTLALTGCARPVGDFGRAAPDRIHDTVLPAAGELRARLGKEPVSEFNLSDQEREMRDRIWRYLVAPHAYDWFGDTLVELQRTRIVPVSGKPLRTDRYYRWLHTERFASSRVRYSRLGEDITLDVEMIPDAFAAICAVREIDRERGVAANGISGIEDGMLANAAARQAENETQIDWFVRALRNRYDSYGYALDHLLVETPHEEAIGVNGSLSDLAAYVEQAERGDFCSSASRAHWANSNGPTLPSRYLRSVRPTKGS